MRKNCKYILTVLLIIISCFLKTSVNAQSDFAKDINTLVEACKNNFEGLKGAFVTSNDQTEIYECTYQIKGYSTTYLAITKSTNYTYVYAALPTTGSTADAACNSIATDFASVPDCNLYDSRNDPNSNEDRRLQGKIAYGVTYIFINAVLTLSANSEIIVSVQKPLE